MNLDPISAKSIFLSAIEIADGAERRAFVAAQCTGDKALLGDVERLLRNHAAQGSFLESPADSLLETSDSTIGAEEPGAVIGPYKLLEQIGQGGFGVVFMAEQTHPVHRRVALKVIKPGMDSKQVVARFEAERQALAVMDHVNIARVIDGGTTELGRPYFVMELVHGIPITKYCDDNHLTPRERLELFVPVCHAIQHAHQKGIIHRDVKPSNVLVTLYDGKPVPKVIDFGVAKATELKLTERTLFTNYGTMVGTLEYMSPEQAEMSALGIDTRSDIYSLGVLLYELLTGGTPLSRKRLKEAALAEILRIIKEEEPPKPSTRLSDSGEALASISANRHMEPAKLTKLVKGELDWIVMKCLEKDRNRRYETANGLAVDLQRYLADEPVQACPPSTWYRVRKFIRRNKGAVAMTGVLGLAALIAAGAIAGSIGWAARVRTERQTKGADQIESIVRELEQFEGEQKWPEAIAAAKRAQAVVVGGDLNEATRRRVDEFLKGLAFVDRLDQTRMNSANWIVMEFDAAGADRQYTEAFREYGVDVDAIPVEESIERLRTRPSLAIPVAAALDDWSGIRKTLKRGAADQLRLVAIARGIDPHPLRDRLRSIWDRSDAEVGGELLRLTESIDVQREHPATLIVLCGRLERTNQQELAEGLLGDAQRAHPGDFWLNFRLAALLQKRNELEGAVRFNTAAASLRPNVTAALNNLALALKGQKKLNESVAVFHRALRVDPKSIVALVNLGNAFIDQEKLDEATAAYRRALEVDPDFAHAYVGLGVVLRKLKKPNEAVAACRKAIESGANYAEAYCTLGNALMDLKKLDEANAAFAKALELNARSTDALNGVGNILRDRKKLNDALATYRKALEIDPNYAVAYVGIGNVLSEQRKLDEAAAAHRNAIALNPRLAGAHHNLGVTLHKQKRFSEAIVALQKAAELDPRLAATQLSLGDVFRDQKKPDDAIAVYRKAIELDPTISIAYGKLGVVLQDRNKLDDAIASFRKGLELDPKLAALYEGLGNVLFAQRKVNEAQAAFRTALELDPKSAAAFNGVGNILAAQKKSDDAIAAYRKAIELDPNYAPPYNGLGNTFAHRKNFDDAIAAYRKATEVDPKAAGAHANLGIVLRAQKKSNEAVAAFRKAIEIDPTVSYPHVHLGAILCDELGEYDQAIECFRRALELDPGNAFARDNLHFARGLKALRLLRGSDPKQRDPKRAREIVDEMVALSPSSSLAWMFRGFVLYRAEDFKGSIEAMEKSAVLGNDGGDAGHWIVLALAHAKLAEEKGIADQERSRHLAEARQRYDAANQRIDRMFRVRPPGGVSQIVWDFRLEAQALIVPKESKK